MTPHLTPHKLIRFCFLLLPLLLSLSGFQRAHAQTITLSTRVQLQAGADAIAGFIITNPSGANPKKVILRGISLGLTVPPPPSPPFTLSEVLADPTLELNGSFGSISNDNWKIDDLTASSQEAAIVATTVPPRMDPESAILMDLAPGTYTAILAGKTAIDSGIALVEIYDLDHPVGKLANISTRAFVGTGGDIVIAGFTLDPTSSSELLVVRGIGPSLSALGVSNVLANPILEVRNSSGVIQGENNDWQDGDPAEVAIIIATGLAPTNNLEAAVAVALPPGDYTALLAGVGSTTGNGLVEIYDLGAP